MTRWMEPEGPLKSFVLSSRIRLARNFGAYPFPQAMTEEAAAALLKQFREGVWEREASLAAECRLLLTADLSGHEKRLLLEKHLISAEFARMPLPGAVMLNSEESVSVMVVEEDHLRIQCLLPGLQLNSAWETANAVDDAIEGRMGFAYDERLGYLTSCPTNVGTGLRASVMMHLPALVMTGMMDRILQAAGQIGLAVRGLYGEGSEALGHMFQISNQMTLGRSERELIETLNDVAGQIAAEERKARELLVRTGSLELEDRIWRAYGILTHARVLSTREALDRLSDLRLGVETGLLGNLRLEQVDGLLFRIQPAFLQELKGQALDAGARDEVRAEYVRGELRG